MKIKKKILLVGALLSLVCFTSCATRYQSQGLMGGYSEIVKSKDSFIVNFSGNEFTSSIRVMKYALMRASELTLLNGYKYFVVVSSFDKTSYIDRVEKPGIRLHIKCYKSEPLNIDVIDAEYFLKQNPKDS